METALARLRPSTSAAGHREPARYLPAFILVGALLTAFAPLLAGRFPWVGDIRTVFLPLESFFQAQQSVGRLPAWLPDAAWGFPAIAAAQIGFFYPPLLIGRYLPLPLYLSALVLFHVLLAASGTYLFLRFQPRSRAGAALGALTFTLGGYLTGHLTHLNIFFAAAWLPWQLFVILRHRHTPFPPLRFAALLAALLALPLLAGQVQVPALMVLMSCAYYLAQHASRSTFSRHLLRLSGIVAWAALLSAAQLLPTAQLLQHSERASRASFDIRRANQYSYPPYHLPTILFPRFYGNDDSYWGKRLQIEYGFYLGTIPFLLALWEIGRFLKIGNWKLKITRPAHIFWIITAPATFLLSLGHWSPFRLLGVEPSLWYFSAPARWLLFTSFAAAVLTAAGADRLTAQPATARYLARRALLVLIPLVLAANVLLWQADRLPRPAPAGRADKITSLIASARRSSLSLRSPYTWLPLLVLTAVLVLPRSIPLPRLMLYLSAAELTALALTSTPHYAWRDILTPPPTLPLLPEAVRGRQARLYSVREEGDTGAIFTNPASRANWDTRETGRRLLEPLLHSQFNLSGIEWPASLPLAQQIQTLDIMRSSSGNAIDLNQAASLNIGAILSAHRQAITVRTIKSQPRFTLQPSGNVWLLQDRPTELTVVYTVDRPAQLTIRDTFFPGWRAFLDEQAVPITLEPPFFRRIAAPAGNHRLTLRFQPRALHFGIGLSLAASAVLAAVLIGTHPHPNTPSRKNVGRIPL